MKVYDSDKKYFIRLLTKEVKIMTRKITIMISSVNKGLEAERDALKEAFSKFEFVELIGSDPFNNSALSGSSAYSTIQMAKKCDIYFLILSNKFGSEITGGQSATEAEFDAAIKDDPTKVMVFKRECSEPIEPKQKAFIDKVSNYYSGYFRPSFKYSHQLQELALNSFYNWLADRAQLNSNLTIIDHFLRIAKGVLSVDNGKIFYRTTASTVELEYVFNNKSYTIYFENTEVIKNFWNCINELQLKYNEWMSK